MKPHQSFPVTRNPERALHRIIVVGGGAGGLELATRLGDTLGKRDKADIMLVDGARTHLWKPLLHQVAAGSLGLDQHRLDYVSQARWHHFRFRLGRMDGLDRERREISVAPTLDDESNELIPRRVFSYDTLIVAVGSRSNDFGTPGVAERAIALDSPEDASRFHRRLLNAGIRAQAQNATLQPGQLQVVIIGAGATGVELAAELRNTTRKMVAYGLDRIDPDTDIKLSIVEAEPRILPMLPERLAERAASLLDDLGVAVLAGERVTAVAEDGVHLQGGSVIPAEIVVWAAGIKAPDFLSQLGLEINRANQLLVRPTLQTTLDANIFAFGDCAECPWLGKEGAVPPRAQAAHQQASHLVKQMKLRLKGAPLRDWRYRDFGSLVSLGEYSTVGNLMGGVSGGSLFIEGLFARMMYLSLYKMHELALHGMFKVALDTLARLITRRTEPHVKLH
ncbi:MAG: NAD(P)/FAD-dependent oxidoreductase [Pseudomonadota bacterium]|nr:NAD(P)/FAD-dependent oxidoreductase [Pseudomonadota bacterium]